MCLCVTYLLVSLTYHIKHVLQPRYVSGHSYGGKQDASPCTALFRVTVSIGSVVVMIMLFVFSYVVFSFKELLCVGPHPPKGFCRPDVPSCFTHPVNGRLSRTTWNIQSSSCDLCVRDWCCGRVVYAIVPTARSSSRVHENAWSDHVTDKPPCLREMIFRIPFCLNEVDVGTVCLLRG